MIHLLTDEQISPEVARTARKLCPGIRITPLRDWMDGHFLGAPDAEVLREALHQKMTLVTFDLRTIPPLLRDWVEAGIEHGGIIFVDERTLAQNDIGGLARALRGWWRQQGSREGANHCWFLARPAD